MAHCMESALLLLLLLGSASFTDGNRCVDAAEACTADERCQQLRSEYVARCLGRAAPGGRPGPGGCVRSRCRRALRRFFARGPPALTHALLFCGCEGSACAERRRQTFAPACAFSGPGLVPPSCLEPLERCERSRLCRCVRAGRAGPLTRVRARAGPVSLPSRPHALPRPAPATAARRRGARVVCASTQAS
uniref:Isoform a3 of GDNF family receptor alpha-4 n=1 Tax=Mus musculus TaxID=10090 RepID=Q9JJT2-3|nr:putative GDNF family receptor alpha 4, secreted isoform [Mus musculus]